MVFTRKICGHNLNQNKRTQIIWEKQLHLKESTITITWFDTSSQSIWTPFVHALTVKSENCLSLV